MKDQLVERILVVTAHPDDVDFGAGGTIAQWTDSGIHVTYLIITDGDAGGFDPDVPRTEIPVIRRSEQRSAGDCVGVHDVRFLGYRDGELAVTHDLRRDISRVIRQVRPQRMLIQSPERNWDRIQASHPDHLAAGEAAIQALYPDARNPFAHITLGRDEELEAWSVPEVWVMAHPTPTHFVDVTDQFDRKLAAIKSHASQLPDPDAMEGWMRTRLAEMAQRGGLPDGRLAEAFFIANTA